MFYYWKKWKTFEFMNEPNFELIVWRKFDGDIYFGKNIRSQEKKGAIKLMPYEYDRQTVYTWTASTSSVPLLVVRAVGAAMKATVIMWTIAFTANIKLQTLPVYNGLASFQYSKYTLVFNISWNVVPSSTMYSLQCLMAYYSITSRKWRC